MALACWNRSYLHHLYLPFLLAIWLWGPCISGGHPTNEQSSLAAGMGSLLPICWLLKSTAISPLICCQLVVIPLNWHPSVHQLNHWGQRAPIQVEFEVAACATTRIGGITMTECARINWLEAHQLFDLVNQSESRPVAVIFQRRPPKLLKELWSGSSWILLRVDSAGPTTAVRRISTRGD